MALDMSKPRKPGYRWYLSAGTGRPVIVEVGGTDYYEYDDSRWLDNKVYPVRADAEGAGVDTEDLEAAKDTPNSRAHLKRNIQAVLEMNNPLVIVRGPVAEWFYTGQIEREGMVLQVVGIYTAQGETNRMALYHAIKAQIGNEHAVFAGGLLSNLAFAPNQL